MLVKRETTSNDTMHSLDAMAVRLMLSRNFFYILGSPPVRRSSLAVFPLYVFLGDRMHVQPMFPLVIVGVLCLVAESPPVQVVPASYGWLLVAWV